MMKLLTLLCLLLPFCAQISAEAASFLRLTEHRAPNGDLSVYIRPVTGFQRSYMVLDARMDGQTIALEHPTKDLWIFKAPTGNHSLALEIFLADARQTDKLEGSYQAVREEIAALEAAIANTTDPEDLAALEAELHEKLKLKLRLERELLALKNFIGREAYSFH